MPESTSELPEAQVLANAKNDSRQRRRFSVEDKQRVLAAADTCTQRGELSVFLRKERIYSSQLNQWRRQFAEHGKARQRGRPQTGA